MSKSLSSRLAHDPAKLPQAWPHDPANLGHAPLAGGPMTLQIGWPHDPAKVTRPWPHEAANWQSGVLVLAVT